MSSVEKGIKVVINDYKIWDHRFAAGTAAVSLGADFTQHYRGTWALFEDEATGETQYLLPEHYDVVEPTGSYSLKADVDNSPKVVLHDAHVQAYEAAKVDGEAAVVEDLPNKVVYGVLNAADEIYATTADRDFARELKAALGGKRKGIRIFQYAAVKEIR